ncbi:putative RNA-directed DNA polymerase [Helianthus debilis subsp. tardiflorus]
MAISSTALNLNSLYTPPRTSPTLLSSSNSSLFTNTFKPLNLVHAHRSSKKTGLSVNCMFGLGVPELAVIAGVATLLFGPKALPEIGRNFGKTLKSFQQDIRTGVIIGRGTERQGLYYVDEVAQLGTVMLAHGTENREAWLWHRRLGHPSSGYSHLLFPKIFSSNGKIDCETCFLAKSHRKTFKPSNTKVDLPFSLIHSDVWGPAPTIGGQGFRFFLIFVDDCTRMTWVYFLKNKSEVYEKFTIFYAMIHTQFKRGIQILRSDNGGEFVNTSMKQFCQTKGLVHQTTCSHTPEQNGVSERKNRIILEMTRALLIESQVPPSFWPEAVATSVYLLNRLPTNALKFKTPLDCLSKFAKIPHPLTLEPRIFGCTAFVHIPKINRNKLGPCAEKCVFVGYGIDQIGYRCYNPKTRHMFTTMNCDFLETKYFYNTQLSGQGESECIDTLSWLIPSSEEVTTEDHHSTLNQSPSNTTTQSAEHSATEETQSNLIPEVRNTMNPEFSTSSNHDNEITGEHTEPVTTKHAEQVEPTTSETATEYTEHVEPVATETTGRYALPPRANRGVPPKRYSPEKEARSSKYPMANVAKGNLSQEAKAFVASLYSEATPTTVEQALKSKNWKEAMKSEMDALRKNDTWEKCIIPEDKKPVGCRWVFTIKHNPDGTIERYKARLVAKGYTQTYGIDYSETFSPVAKINTIRVLFSIAANKQWPLHQFDVKNAFLHGELEEEVYMEAPPGFTESFKPGEVCRLKKSLYGLKQSPRAWFGRFTLAMKKYGFKQSNSDHTLFLKQRGKLITCLIIYVDDMIVTGNDEEKMKRLKANLFSEFEMKDLGRLKYFLGIEVLRSNRGIFICQKKYILDLLAETGMIDCKPSDTPMIMNQKLCMEEGAQLTDRDWAGDKGDRRSTSGYFTLVGGNLVTWRSKKQKVVALSSAEAEFRGIARGLTEVLWAAKEFETELKKDDPELLEESATAVNEMVDQENKDAKSTQVSL